MATKSLDIALRLFIQGGGDVKTLGQQVQALKREIDKLDSSASLDKLFKKGVTDLDAFIKKAFELQRQLGKPVKFDLDLSKPNKELDLIAQKARTAFDLLVRTGTTKLDLNLNQVNRQLDQTVEKGRQLVDVFARAGRTKVDFNLGKIEAEAQRAAIAIRNYNAQQERFRQQQENSRKAVERHHGSIRDLTSGFLFARRAVIAFTAVLGVREILDVVKAYDAARQAIAAVFPDNAAEQFNFVKEQADRLGLSITALATQYSKFSAAGKALALDQELIRENFLAVAEAGAKLALSQEQIEGALTAIQQIASKGRLSMEELRQQLGDRLPGAISIAAKALGVTEQRLFALVEAGQITSERFLKTFPAALREAFGTDVTTRIDTTGAAIERFKNSVRELTDTVVRAGALDAFTTIMSELTKIFKDPATIASISAFSKGVKDLTLFIIENSAAVKQLLLTLGGLFLFSKLTGIILGFSAAVTKLAKIFPGVGVGAAGAAAGIKTYAGAATEGTTSTTNFVSALGSLALATKNPIVIAVAGLAALDAVLITAFIAKLDKAREAAFNLAEQQRELASSDKLTKVFLDQAAALDQASNASETLVFSRKEINSLSEDGLRDYVQSAQAAKELAEIEVKATEQQVKGLRLRIQAHEESAKKTDEAIRQNSVWRDQLADAEAALKSIKGRVSDFGAALDDATERANKQGIALTAYQLKLQKTAELALMLSGRLVQSGQAGVIAYKDLNKEGQILVDGFKNLITAGKTVEEAFKALFPKDLGDATVSQLEDVGNALAFIGQEGLASGKQIREGIGAALEKLTGNELNKFAINAKSAFDTLKLSAQGLSTLLDGQLRAALKNMGLDADEAGGKISKSFKEMLDNLRAVGNNAQVTGAQLRGALEISIEQAKTREELLALKATIGELSEAAIKFGDDIVDALLRLDDKIRLSGAVMDTALGDSFERLGVKAKSQLDALAAQAEVDFQRIKQSGQASTQQLEEAFKRFAEQATLANNGIPPIELRFAAVEANAFDFIVNAAETAGDKVRKAIENAIPLAETKAQLEALADAIEYAFDRGKLSIDEFGKLATEVGYKLTEAIAKPTGELAAAAELLGLKTKEQLEATAQNASDAFSEIATSGEFTNAELAKGAQQFLDAAIAANNGVVDSFDPVVAKALEVLEAVNADTAALQNLQDQASAPITTSVDLKSMGIQELQQFLLDTVKAYRQIGVQNVQDLQVVRETQAELERKARVDADERQKRFEDFAATQNQLLDKFTEKLDTRNQPQQTGNGEAPGGGVPGFKGANTTVNFNITGGNFNEDTIRRSVVPILRDKVLRGR
jgi:tape measure domain-containing protein